MVGQISRYAKAKKGETGITCRSLSTGLESRTKPQPNKQHQQTNTKARFAQQSTYGRRNFETTPSKKLGDSYEQKGEM